MNVPRRLPRAAVGGRLRRSATYAVTLVVTLAASLSLVGAVAAPSATAAVGDDVIAWVEVEDGEISGGPGLNSGDHGNFSGTGSYTFRETGMMSTMSVNAPEAGVYPVYVRYAAGPLAPEENVTRSMGLLTNGGARQQMSLPMTSFENWEAWRFVEYDVTLAQGDNTIAIQCDRGTDFCRLNFDAIQVGGTAPDPCAATPPSPGFTSLFDGTFATFDGWRKAGTGGFGRQTDCTIRSMRGRGATWLTQPQTEPYTLELDWRRNDSNDDSGVYLASSARGGADPVGGYRIPIGAGSGAIQPTGGTTKAPDQNAHAGALRPVGQWNTYTLQVTSSRIRVNLNGVLINSLARSATGATNGYLGLENKSGIDEVDFRRIQIRPGVDPVGSTTAMTVAPTSLPVKRGTASVAVSVASVDGVATGSVELWAGAAKLSTLPLVEGKATGTVGPFPTPGPKTLEARYLGDALTAPSSSPVRTVVVAKAAARITAKVQPRRITARKTRPVVTVVVSAAGVTPTGVVRVRIGAKTYAGMLRGGRATVRLARLRKAGTVRATVTYAGDAMTKPITTTTKFRVRKAARR
jgi:hypothetical protein